MSLLDDEIDLIDNSNESTEMAYANKVMEKFPISKPFLGGYKHHGKNRVGYDCFGRPLMQGDWVVFKTTTSGDQHIDGLAFGIVKNIGKKNVKVIRRSYSKGWYSRGSNPAADTDTSMVEPISIFKIDDKNSFIESIREDLNK